VKNPGARAVRREREEDWGARPMKQEAPGRQSGDGTVYDSTNGWRIERVLLAREADGTLDADITEGKSRTEILIASREAIARLVRTDVRTSSRRGGSVKRIGADDERGRS
jgi:hypothetical protein